MPASGYIEFPESHHEAPANLTDAGPVADNEMLTVSLYLKPRRIEHDLAESDDPRRMMSEVRQKLHRHDIEAIRRFASAHGLRVVEEAPARRLVRLEGSAAAMREAFKVTLRHHQRGGEKFRYYTGALHLHEEIAPVVESVLGLDTRPVARHRIVIRNSASVSPSYLPNRIGALYGIPATPNGAGETIAIIELGGGYTDADNRDAFTAMGLNTPAIVAVSVDGATNQPTSGNGADAEVALDIQVAGGIAPGARIAVYFTSNTDAGFADAVSAAAADTANKPSVMSISWGAPEDAYSAQARNTLNTAIQDAGMAGVTVAVACGDNLATDGETDGKAHVDFPAASPYAVACGGTKITVSNGAITDETVWNSGSAGTGGGISAVFAVPSYQSDIALPASANDTGPGRGLPDVAGDADPASGYQLVVNGQTEVVGGTSAVAPLYAGFFALANQAAGRSLGFVHPALYASKAAFRDITTGSNIPSGTAIGYEAGPGWDACTGLGVLKGDALLTALSEAVATVA